MKIKIYDDILDLVPRFETKVNEEKVKEIIIIFSRKHKGVLVTKKEK